ncbi:efflux RND transporter permease subunit [Ectothiorhodospiraceae bacterium 2226]|nr:efflux RND transporter permease subunit [Ectothiorhodospiraceae bacterium 2226]
MNWPQWVLRYKHAVIALLLAVLVLGVQARFELPVQLFPDTDPPTVTVITEYPGMAAADVDAELTKLLEEEVASIDGVVRIASSSQAGLSVVRVEFVYGREAALAAVDVQNAISRIRRQLPTGIGEPQVLEFSTADKPIVTAALRGHDLPLTDVRELADNAVRERLERVPGVAAVDVFGGYKPELHVALRRDRLEAYGLDMDRVVRALADWNLSAPGGRVRHGTLESVVRFDAPIRGAEDAAGIVLVADGGRRVRVGDVADVRLMPGEARAAYRHNGEPAIAVQILKRGEANTVEVARAVREALAELQDALPALEIAIADDDSVFTEHVIADMTRTVMIAIALTVLIVLLFLANLRQAAIIGLSIPAAFLATFGLMQLAGLDLNMVTMSALILAIGLLVDDGIVVLENIHRHMDADKPPLQAAVDGTAEILTAKLGGSLTTLSVLIPLVFLGGFVGELFRPLALTLGFALSASFVMSVTLIPLLGAYWLKPTSARPKRPLALRVDRTLHGTRVFYLAGLHAAIRHPVATLVLALLLLAGSLVMLRVNGSEMLPRFDSGSFRVLVDLAAGSTLQDTARAAAQVEAHLLAQDYTTGVSVRMGHEPAARALGDRGAMAVNQAEITVNLTPRTARAVSQWTIMDQARDVLEAIPGVTLGAPKEMGGTARAGTAAPIVVRASGTEPAALDAIADALLARLRDVPGITDLYKDWGVDTPELHVRLDNERVAELGLTGVQVAQAVHRAVDGQVATPFRQPLRRDLQVVVRYAEGDRRYAEHLEDVMLRTPVGAVPLREVAALEHRLGPRVITREDGQRTLEVLGFHLGRPLSEVVADVQARLAAYTPPPGYTVVLAGEQEDFTEAQARMVRAMAFAALAVYLLLVIQFRSFRHPVTVMSAIPLQFIGVAAALLIAGKYVSMPALLGIILLVGIVVNNGIILLDFANQRRAAGRALQDAIADAVEARFRPIMMTALSTIAGMLPLALEMAVGAERFSPIATVIIGGVAAATVLTLVVVPSLYVLLERRRASEPDGEGAGA